MLVTFTRIFPSFKDGPKHKKWSYNNVKYVYFTGQYKLSMTITLTNGKEYKFNNGTYKDLYIKST